MARLPDPGVLWRASLRRKWLGVEAAWELVRARIDTLRPASHYTRHLGEMGEACVTPAPGQEKQAAEIGHVVSVVSGMMPFRALCLQQALAVRRMLRRRDVPAVVYLGLAQDPADRQGDTAAHAWVKTGGRIVSGNTDLSRYAVVGVFS